MKQFKIETGDLSLILPDGRMLIARVFDEQDYPSIRIFCVHQDEAAFGQEDLICFAEFTNAYNGGATSGVAVGVYDETCDEPKDYLLAIAD